jgi:hypothetical protein
MTRRNSRNSRRHSRNSRRHSRRNSRNTKRVPRRQYKYGATVGTFTASQCVNESETVCKFYEAYPKWVEHYRKIASFLQKGDRFLLKNDQVVSNSFIISICHLVNNKVDLEQYFKEELKEEKFIPEIFYSKYPVGFEGVIQTAKRFLKGCSECGLFSSGPCTKVDGRCVTNDSMQTFMQKMEEEFGLFLNMQSRDNPVRFNGFSFGVHSTFLDRGIKDIGYIFKEMYKTSKKKEIVLYK